ncbi:precorrin-2 dehydrogenase/sirohydrochlorin ferrochelatase family protein [Sphingomonas rubra]|uniref:precorrin-2 dehydrogenase n=1 Tax=Sphingomonas rubra TaxID=634430 RepID=A0A1I5UKL5_9SPHN|nr:bifunctional precorrin-2 dehydrogenase/sirohydrochlorin ferrochelatase [Sphingomonas rubra]SFP95851.1 uroporphyrin-III C-methyltransferase / precorrin-2 dehydrogenase / sirohydrochlorin ferrochelatase [Sphingomonas rubra]
MPFLHSLPLFVRLHGRPVILLGEGDAADAKRRLLARAGAAIVGEDAPAALAIVAIDDEAEALAAVARFKARGLLVNAVDRPDHCDFTLPAIVDRDPVIVAIGTGGVSAGLAAALRQRLEALLPSTLGALAHALQAGRGTLRARFPDAGERRRAIAAALAPGGSLDPLGDGDPAAWLADPAAPAGDRTETIVLRSADPDDLTLREARLLASADRVFHDADVPPAILDRARADAARIVGSPRIMPGLSIVLRAS